MKKILPALVLGLAALAVLAGCTKSTSHSAALSSASARAHAAAAAAATNTAVAADKAQAQKDLATCVNTGHIATAKACLKADVPPAKRHALETCLTKAAVLGWATFKKTGAQACLAVALQ